MRLLLDIGNSSLRWQQVAQQEWLARGAIRMVPLDLYQQLSEQWHALAPPQQVWVACVAGDEVRRQVSHWLAEHWQCEVYWPQAQAQAYGVTNAYSDPERLGVDRWLALLAGRARYQQACCVVDCGTAITLDVLDQAGVHQGGLILPGIGLMRQSLQEHTQINLQQDQANEIALLARDTSDAVQGGTLYAAVALIDRVLQDVRHALGMDLKALITGGDAEQVVPLLAQAFEHAPDLVLQGLELISRNGQA